MSAAPVLPGVWERKEGGHVVRARVKDPATGHTKELFKVLPNANATAALQWLDEERADELAYESTVWIDGLAYQVSPMPS